MSLWALKYNSKFFKRKGHNASVADLGHKQTLFEKHWMYIHE